MLGWVEVSVVRSDSRALGVAHAYGISHVKETEVGEQGKVAYVDLAKTFEIAKRTRTKDIFRWNGTVRGILMRGQRV